MTEFYKEWAMDLAFKEAELALAELEVPVGCVIVAENAKSETDVKARGRNKTNIRKNATRHAEMEAFSNLGSLPSNQPSNRLLGDLELYVTVEPCIMCAMALSLVGIKRVFYGCGNEKFGGCASILTVNDGSLFPSSACPASHGVIPYPYESYGGFRKADAIMLLRRFYMIENEDAPKPSKKKNRILKPYE